jgi:hypothetical protein
MKRREVFPILSTSLAAQHEHHTPSATKGTRPWAGAKPKFFSDEEYADLAALLDTLLPREGEIPSASDVGCHWYIDTLLHYNTKLPGAEWKKGLAGVRGVNRWTEAKRNEKMASWAANEFKPTNDGERFFARMKQMAIDAYCHSDEAQKKAFGYKGNQYLSEFPGN